MQILFSRLLKSLLFILIVSLSACASTTNDTGSSTGGPEIEVPAGKAVIYFFRPSSMSGGAIKFNVHDMQGKPMGYLGKSGDSFSIVVEPGTHQYWSRAASRNDVEIIAEAGKIYYVQGSVNMGFVVGRPVLKQVSASDVPK